MKGLELHEKEALLDIALKLIDDIEDKDRREYAWKLYQNMQDFFEDESDSLEDTELLIRFYLLVDWWWLHE